MCSRPTVEGPGGGGGTGSLVNFLCRGTSCICSHNRDKSLLYFVVSSINKIKQASSDPRPPLLRNA